MFTNGKHSLFVLYNMYKDSYFQTNLKEKVLKDESTIEAKTYSQAKRPTLRGEYYAGARVTLNHALRLRRFPRVEFRI